ncbi:hypothetical protein N0V85_004872 [Neurospora sp. IMI 360204]|nr:hypothetical protein N0V85_004872 [Neurospora sp. IMI 360204]
MGLQATELIHDRDTFARYSHKTYTNPTTTEMHLPLLPLTLAHFLTTLTTLIPPISAAEIANTDPIQKPISMIDSFRKSCVNWQIDSAACSIHGICKLTDDSKEASHPKLHGWRETNLDLNECIWFDAKESKLKWFEEKDGKVEDLSG